MKQTDKQKNAMLGELFEQFHGVILRAIVRTLGAEYSYLAEDCLSQTFLIACQKKGRPAVAAKPRRVADRHGQKLRAQRDARCDQGTKLYHPA